jgi:hypothetical protein
MTTRCFLFALWCMALFAGTVATSYYAWSPFADGQRGAHPGFYGPAHK